MFYKKAPERKTPEEKEQKQLEMAKLDVNYEQFLAGKVAEKRAALLAKYPTIKTLFEGWVYGVYVAILDNQQAEEKTGKIYYLFENIPESSNKYKFSYSISDNNDCVFNVAELKSFPKPYLSILKRHGFDLNSEKADLSQFIAFHVYKLDESAYIHHADYNRLNNNVKNLVPFEKEFFESMSDEVKKNISKAHQYIPEKYRPEIKKKPKDVVKMEYRACDLYYNHRIPPEKVAVTLRNRLKKADVQRIAKIYPYFKEFYTQRADGIR